MNSGARHKQQRSNRVRLKADCVVLLDRLGEFHVHALGDEIAEMRVRLHPKPGVPAPIVLTGYTDNESRVLRAVMDSPIAWKAEAAICIKGFDSMRYRKD